MFIFYSHMNSENQTPSFFFFKLNITYYGIVGLQPTLAPCTLFKTYVAENLDDSLLHACNYPVSQLAVFVYPTHNIR